MSKATRFLLVVFFLRILVAPYHLLLNALQVGSACVVFLLLVLGAVAQYFYYPWKLIFHHAVGWTYGEMVEVRYGNLKGEDYLDVLYRLVVGNPGTL